MNPLVQITLEELRAATVPIEQLRARLTEELKADAAPFTIFGMPVVVDPELESPREIIFGDFSAYIRRPEPESPCS